MISFADIMVVIGLFVLRIGVPVAIVAGLAYFLKRLDRRWEEEARAQRAAEQPFRETAAQKLAAKPAPRPVALPGIPVPGDRARLPQMVVPGSGARPCWETKNCPETIFERCPAYLQAGIACWQARLQAEGKIPEKCTGCEIFQTYPTA